MILQGKQIYLRPIEPDDAQGDYPNWLNDPDVCRYNSHGETLYTREMARSYIDRVTADPSQHVFAICLSENNRHIGNISLQQISLRNRNAELAILIGDPSVYGRGIGYEAGKLLLDYAFGVLKLHRVYCGTHGENSAMQRLALAWGMTLEGKRRDAIFKNKKFADVVEYGLLDNEYQKDES